MLGKRRISVWGMNLAACIRTRKSGMEANWTQYIFSAISLASRSLERSSRRILAPSSDVVRNKSDFNMSAKHRWVSLKPFIGEINNAPYALSASPDSKAGITSNLN